MKDYSLAAIAYQAYCRASGGRSLISGASLPGFDGLRPIIKEAWWEAAREVERETQRRSMGDGDAVGRMTSHG